MASHKIPDQLYVEARTYQGVHKESNGYKLLASMGWKEGEGLGTSGQGIKEHISVKKKNDSLGIGQEKFQNRDEDWLQSMSMFDKVLSNLKEVKTEPKTTGDIAIESKKKENSVTKKKKKSLKSDPCLQKKKDSRTASKEVGKEHRKRKATTLIVEQTALGKNTVSHVGRFRRQEEAKSVCKYSAGDLSAILGGASLSQPKTSADTIRMVTPEVQVEGCGPSDNESDSEKWWATKFIRAGTLQKTRKSPPPIRISDRQIKVHGFSEADQTQLYSQVQNAATSGRQGLGKSSVRKVAGAKIGQGKQTTFSSDDEDDQAVSDRQQGPNSDVQEGTEHVICMVAPGSISGLNSIGDRKAQKKPKMKSSTGQHQELKENRSDAKRIKNLRKLASKTLKVHGGQLKVAKLCKLIKKALNSTENQSKYCSDEVKVVLKASKKFKVDGKLAIRVR